MVVEPCPFCGSINIGYETNQGSKWGYVYCAECAAQGPETRTQYDLSDDAPWRARALEEWNKRETFS